MDAYEEFFLAVRRDLNCLADADRTVRRNAIVRLEKTLVSGGKVSLENSRRLFLEELHKPIFRMYADQTEKCRALSISMTAHFITIVAPEDLENIVPLLLAALLGRLRVVPFPEQSEELRLELLKLLGQLFDICKDQLNAFAGDIIDGLSKALSDTCPDAKKECCEIVKKVAVHLDAERCSRASGPLVAALLANLRHQHWKVRRATLQSLGSLLSLEAMLFDHMEDALPVLGMLLADRTVAVRTSLAECLEMWLLKGLSFRPPQKITFDDHEGAVGFQKFENRLLLLMLSVVADEEWEQVGKPSLSGLERVAVFKQEVRLKQRQKDQDKVKAREAHALARGDSVDANANGSDVPEIELAPEFDYTAIQTLLPEPFVSASTPGVLTTTFVQLHLPVILPQVLRNLTQWTVDIRTSAANLLRVLLVLVNREVSPFLDSVLVHLYKASADDEKSVGQIALQCAEMLGTVVDVDLLLSLLGRHLGLRPDGGDGTPIGPGPEELWPENRTGRTVTRTVQDNSAASKNFTAMNTESRRQVFAVLAHVLRPAPSGSLPRLQLGNVRTVLTFLEEGVQNEDLLPWVFGAVQALLTSTGDVCTEEWPRAFDILLRMRSSDECNASAVDGCMDQLASLCGRSRRELYSEHLRTRLQQLLAGADSALWEERSPNRHILETLLRNAGSAVAEHIGSLTPVLARQASRDDASAPARVDILGLVHFLVTQEDPTVTKAVQEQSPALLLDVLVPNCAWKPGQSNNAIRKASIFCIHAMLQRHLVAASVLNGAFTDLMPILKGCLDDTWSPDNRMFGMLVISCLLSELQAEINGEQLREIYPELLKRLDDSNDKIRAVTCEALSMFFKCMPPKWSKSLYEYILKSLFVHLDDPNPEIQRGIHGVLEVAVHQDYAAFIQEAQIAMGKSAHPRACEELMRLADTLMKADGDVIMD